jgi:phage terminase large subunit-like protein
MTKLMSRSDKEKYLRLLKAKVEYNQLFYTPTQKQIEFHKSSARRVFIRAGSQSGKSFAATHEVAWWVTELHPFKQLPIPKMKIAWVVGKSKRMVTDDLWELYLKKFIPERFIEKISYSSSIIEKVRLNTGWEIRFKSYDQGREALQGTPVDLVLITEQPPMDCFEEIEARVAATEGTILMDFTPLKMDRKLKDYLENSSLVDIIRMSRRDNPVIDQVKLEEEIKNWPKAKIATRIDGEWFAYEGRLIPSFTEDNCTIPFRIPETWRKCISIDPATSTETGIVWLAENPNNGDWYCYREALLKELAPSKLIRKIVELTGVEKIDSWYYDQQAAYLSKEAMELGIFLTPVKKANENENMVSELNQAFANKSLFIFKDLDKTTDHIMNYINDPNSEEFKPVKEDDHLVDALKYFWRGKPVFYGVKRELNRMEQIIDNMLKKNVSGSFDPTMGSNT